MYNVRAGVRACVRGLRVGDYARLGAYVCSGRRHEGNSCDGYRDRDRGDVCPGGPPSPLLLHVPKTNNHLRPVWVSCATLRRWGPYCLITFGTSW